MLNLKYIPILDNGHGGLIAGVYQTPGKRSPDWHHGVLYEGAFNRWFVNRLKEELDRRRIPYFHVSPELEDKPLKDRVREANAIHRYYPNAYFLSIHANAGGGSGIEIYTSRGDTDSDRLASLLFEYVKGVEGLSVRTDYSDGDPDKEAGFYVLRKTTMPAVLLETAFMDNKNDYELLWNRDFLSDYVNRVADFVTDLYFGKIKTDNTRTV